MSIGAVLVKPRQNNLIYSTAEAVSLRPLTVEAWVRARGSTCGICGGQSGTGTVFLLIFGFPLSISFHRSSTLIHHLWDE
jgi:hypothetical protein